MTPAEATAGRPYAPQPHRSQLQAKHPGATLDSPPPGGGTGEDTIPSVITVSTQGGRVLHTRGAPAHTGDDTEAKTETERKGNKDGIIRF